MKKFPNRLQRVLDAKQAVLSQCEMQLADAQRKLQQYHSQQEACLQRVRQHEDVAKEGVTRPVREHMLSRAWFHHLVHKLEEAIKTSEKQKTTVQAKREALKNALVDCRIMENLTARQRLTWVKDMQRLEQKQMDENALLSYMRRLNRLDDTTFPSMKATNHHEGDTA